jgi:hypothetical protein
MTAANPATPCSCEKNVGGHSAYLHRAYRALEAENIRLGNENRALHGDCDALRTENAALKARIAECARIQIP